MNREKLLKNMTDQVKEAQLKLGYAKETVRLYYPVDSLNTILGSNAKDDQEMLTLLRKRSHLLENFIFTAMRAVWRSAFRRKVPSGCMSKWRHLHF